MRQNYQNQPHPFNHQAGFTMIELMVVVIIMVVVSGFVGWNYLQYHQRSAVEASARTLRSFLNDAKTNAKNGKYMSSYYSAESTSLTPDAACYVGDLSQIRESDKSVECRNASPGVGPSRAGGPSTENGGTYYSWLEMVASGGIVLNNWGVFFDPNTAGRLEMRALCKTRPRCVTPPGIGRELYSMNTGGSYEYPPNVSSTVDRVNYLEPGVQIVKPVLTPGVEQKDYKGVEFMPLYLAVQYPLDTTNKVNFGASCFGEKNNEIVMADADGRYLYKFTVGEGGDVSEGCFCAGNWRSGNMVKSWPVESECDASIAASDDLTVAPCGECQPR